MLKACCAHHLLGLDDRDEHAFLHKFPLICQIDTTTDDFLWCACFTLSVMFFLYFNSAKLIWCTSCAYASLKNCIWPLIHHLSYQSWFFVLQPWSHSSMPLLLSLFWAIKFPCHCGYHWPLLLLVILTTSIFSFTETIKAWFDNPHKQKISLLHNVYCMCASRVCICSEFLKDIANLLLNLNPVQR